MAPTKPLSGWNPNEPAYWWVNQKGPSFRQERAQGCIWAPKTDRRGGQRKQYSAMHLLKPGHVLFHYTDKAVRALSWVVEAATDAPPPAGGQHGVWSDPGNLVRVEYHDLPRPIPLHEIPVDWRVGEGGPFNTTEPHRVSRRAR